ncbi:hypothetical protein PF008_g20456 [Phytophthora fragariae]|uniref:Secreted protein n=1 Tax=Phytophthora fragariae TaxID=53985 RepID=A0A6G0R0I9_9STRA|nr:hypothetical protein PF008_g20456 [Phytophthora fragariae]
MPLASHHCVLLLVAYQPVRTCHLSSQPSLRRLWGLSFQSLFFTATTQITSLCHTNTTAPRRVHQRQSAPDPPPINDVAQLEERRAPSLGCLFNPGLSYHRQTGWGSHAPTAFNHCATPDGASLI